MSKYSEIIKYAPHLEHNVFISIYYDYTSLQIVSFF